MKLMTIFIDDVNTDKIKKKDDDDNIIENDIWVNHDDSGRSLASRCNILAMKVVEKKSSMKIDDDSKNLSTIEEEDNDDFCC